MNTLQKYRPGRRQYTVWLIEKDRALAVYENCSFEVAVHWLEVWLDESHERVPFIWPSDREEPEFFHNGPRIRLFAPG